MEDFKDLVEVFDTKRPSKKSWMWSRSTFEKYQQLSPGRFMLKAPKIRIEPQKIKVKDINGQPKAKQKRGNFKTK